MQICEKHAVFAIVIYVRKIWILVVAGERELRSFGLASVGVGVNGKDLDSRFRGNDSGANLNGNDPSS